MQSASPTAAPVGSSHVRLALGAAFALVAVAYLLQIASPLRLINDGVDYLLQACSALDGHGFTVRGVHSMRPPGYPALIFLLAKAGIGTSWAIVALNCLFLGIACWAAYHVLRESFDFSTPGAQFIVLLTLLSFVVVRNVAYPLSDICYFGESVPCLLMLLRAERQSGSSRLLLLVIALPLLLFSIALRTIGIVLFPAFLWAAIGGMDGVRKAYPSLRRHAYSMILLVVAVTLAAGWGFIQSRYWQFNSPTFHHRGLIRSVTANFSDHTGEWGEMTLNAPLSKIPSALSWPVRALGLLAILTSAFGMWTKRRQPDSLLIYTIGYACIVFAYPWLDSRLWLPLLPFLMAYLWNGLKHLLPQSGLRPLRIVWCSGFCLLGIAALAYSTRLTFAGSRFPDIYGDGNFRAAYALVLRGEAPKDGKVDQDAVDLLRRFEWRARAR